MIFYKEEITTKGFFSFSSTTTHENVLLTKFYKSYTTILTEKTPSNMLESDIKSVYDIVTSYNKIYNDRKLTYTYILYIILCLKNSNEMMKTKFDPFSTLFNRIIENEVLKSSDVYDHINKIFKNITLKGGNSIPDNNQLYEHKYIKYKNMYVNLKKQLKH